MLRNALALYPQCIIHDSFEARAWGIEPKVTAVQVLYVMVTCPMDGSLKQLVLRMLEAIDDVAGTSYARRSRRGNGATLINLLSDFAVAASNLHLGVLVVDEIQNLSSAKSGGHREMLKFFVAVQETLRIPVVLVGTPDAASILHRNLSVARRGAGPVWGRYEKQDSDIKDWHTFLETLWRYQYTRHYVKYDKAMVGLLSDLSQGIMDMAVRIFALAQQRAIDSTVESLTSDIFLSVFDDSLSGVRDALVGLADNDPRKLALYEDLVGALRSKPTNDPQAMAASGPSDAPAVSKPAGQKPTRKVKATVRRPRSVPAGGLVAIFDKASKDRVAIYDRLKEHGVIKSPIECYPA